MPGVRQWAGRLMLRAPEPLRSLRDAPIIGGLIHRWSHSVLPADEKVWVRVKTGPAKGIWLRLNPRTGQEYRNGGGEVRSQQILAERLQPGDVFYDLGANIGLFSLMGARLVGPAGKVFSFEPDREAAARLRENAQRNGSINVSVTEAGVWSTCGMRDFVAATEESPDRGTGSFVAAVGGTAILCISLDEFTRTAPPPNAIKCDVEGAEIEVLRGAMQVLKAHRPWILCETHSPECDLGARELLTQLGYRIQPVDANHFLASPLST